jgi:ubiquinone/menaquinone biosynthesis C-methylase UbiE
MTMTLNTSPTTENKDSGEDKNSTFAAFNRDVRQNTGYLYTTKARISSRIANRRLSDATLEMANWKDKVVIDIGCGDGTYSIELYRRGQVKSLCGVDPAQEAVTIANQKHGHAPNIKFETQDAYQLPYNDNSFDIAYVRGVLHHVDDAREILREAFRVAPTVVVIEPNGFNPVLKLIEKVSPYHKQHQEKSYSPALLDKWCEELGAQITKKQFAGLVPFFCPAVAAYILKYFEPLVEALPMVNRLSCAVYIFTATRTR